ncbi:MAG: EamA family transporter [Gammaproteobacteria bacterium HGW-Gammaproteobacteria-4]|jgi:drug/metabolite transporter (DMT)-like permease|nr:MAG: EamA family transporter [Gammaproteobacteria bacterium HGW-Gammaproteobacteria-4]
MPVRLPLTERATADVSRWQLPLLTALTLVAFAGNSVLGRLALATTTIEPAAYTLLRLASGALMLAALVHWRHRYAAGVRRAGDWYGAAALFVYAAAFSFSYVSVATGLGALLLFGAVQITMIVAGMIAGERPRPLHWLGLIVAFVGLVLLTRPGRDAPPLLGSALMLAAGIAWGVYSLHGRRSRDPLAATAGNFVRASVLAVALAVLVWPITPLPADGVGYALLSGMVTSGLGYALWYRVLPALSAVRAASLQLIVPVLATLAGAVLVAEPITLRVVVSGVLVLGGIALTLRRG